MAEITKVALKVDNNTSFPNNNNGAITPSILRAFNTNMIDSLVDEVGYTLDSGSWNQQIDALEQFTASASGLTTGSLLITASAVSNVITFTKGNGTTFNVTVADTTDLSQLNQATASLQAYTASANIKFANLDSTTASLNSSITQLNANTASQQVSINNLNTTTASLLVETQNLELFSASALISITNLNQSSASQQISIDNLNQKTGSYATTGSNTFVGANTFTSISASSFISASEFVGNGSKLTGITASISMPILDEGIPQGNAVSLNFTGSAIGATVIGGIAIISVNGLDTGSYNALTQSFNSYTASTNADLNAIHQATASLQQFTASFSTSSLVSTSSFNAYTASNDQRVTSLETNSASVNISVTNLNTFSSSVLTQLNTLANVTSSLISKTGSYATTGSNTFVGNQTITGNITAFSASFTYLQTTFESSSVIYSSGSNIFGDELSDTQTLSGSVKVQGSLTVNGTPVQTSSVDISALNSFTASQYVSNSFFATTGSNSFIGNQTITGSLIISSSAVFDLIITGAANIVDVNGLAQLGLNPNNFNVNTTKATGVQAYGQIFAATGSNAEFYLGVYDDPNFNTDVELKINVDTGSGIVFNDWDNVSAGDYVPFMTLTPNLGNNPSPVMTRGLQVTGSTQVQNFTASLQQGYVYVGNASGITTTVATSSFVSTINTGSFATLGANTFTGSQTISSSLNVSGSANFVGGDVNFTDQGRNINIDVDRTIIKGQKPTLISSSLDIQGSLTASLANGYAWVGDATNHNVLVATSSFATNVSNLATTGSNSFNGNQTITGSLILSSSNAVELTVIGNMVVTGSAFGNVVSMSITANTASMDLSLGNYFTLTLAGTATTHISASNVQPGVSATLVITTGTNSSASLAPTMLQPSGSAYSATNGSAKKDVLSIVAVASGVPFVVSTKNMI